MQKYESAKSKLGRAKHHIQDLEAAISKIPAEKYRIIVDRDTHPGEIVLKLQTEKVDPILSLITGDAAVNIRSALDHAFAAALSVQNTVTGQIQFPIRDNAEGLKGSLQKTAKNVAPIPKPLWELIVNDIKPYDGQPHFLSALNKLANLDKHRIVATLAGLSGVRGSFVAGGARMENIFIGTQAGQEVGLIRMPANTQFHGNLKPVLKIEFGESVIPTIYRKEVVPTLSTFAEEIALIIDKIERACP